MYRRESSDFGGNADYGFNRAQQNYDNQTDDRFDHDVEAIELDSLEEDMQDEDWEFREVEPDYDSENENW